MDLIEVIISWNKNSMILKKEQEENSIEPMKIKDRKKEVCSPLFLNKRK